MFPRIIGLAGKAYDLLFPRRCVGCGREGDYVCPACREAFRPIVPPLCARCGVPISPGPLCPACAGWEAAIDGIRSAFNFEGPAREAVHQLKYRNLRAIAPDMAALMLSSLSLNAIPGDVLVPVPLHAKRLRARGYNQSALLARELGRLAGLAVAESGLVRRRNTSSQARTRNVLERRENVDGAFFSPGDRVRGQRVILVDDVATSGATLNAGAAALKAAGATSVWGVTFAREI